MKKSQKFQAKKVEAFKAPINFSSVDFLAEANDGTFSVVNPMNGSTKECRFVVPVHTQRFNGGITPEMLQLFLTQNWKRFTGTGWVLAAYANSDHDFCLLSAAINTDNVEWAVDSAMNAGLRMIYDSRNQELVEIPSSWNVGLTSLASHRERQRFCSILELKGAPSIFEGVLGDGRIAKDTFERSEPVIAEPTEAGGLFTGQIMTGQIKRGVGAGVGARY